MAEVAQANRDDLECSFYTWQMRHSSYVAYVTNCQGNPPPPGQTAIHSATDGSGFPRQASAGAIRNFVANAVCWMRFLRWLEEPEAARHPHADEVDA